MAIQGGFGVVLKINTGSLTTIVGLLDTEFPKQSKGLSEATGHDATSGYYIAVATGKKRLEPFRATLAWDDSATTHAQVLTSFGSDASVNMSIADPDGNETIAFAAFIESIGRISKQDGTYQAEVMIHPTGAPTIT